MLWFCCAVLGSLAVSGVSRGHNRAYLALAEHKAQVLAAKITQWYKEPNAGAVPDALNDARGLATYPSLDLATPNSTFRYGLYAAPAVAATRPRHLRRT